MEKQEYTTIERWPSDHFNPHDNIIVTYQGDKVELETSFGSEDEVEVYAEGNIVYVLSLNNRLQYIGLDVYNVAKTSREIQHSKPDTGINPYETIFIDRDYDLISLFGDDPFYLDLLQVLQTLQNHYEV